MRAWILTGVFLVSACKGHESIDPRFELEASAGEWTQWGRDAAHHGSVDVAGQSPKKILASAVFDPFVTAEKKEAEGDILVHYQSPLVDGADVFMEAKSGRYAACDKPGSGMPAPCGSDSWPLETWNEQAFRWLDDGILSQRWTFESDWKPPFDGGGLGEWEPVFHAALAGPYLVVPGASGTIFVVNRENGAAVTRVNPFDDMDPNRFVTGPLTVDSQGNVFYNVIAFATAGNPWANDVRDAWLVKVAPTGTTKLASYSTFVKSPILPCSGGFSTKDLPFPPAPDAKPPVVPCGAIRPGMNVAPAIGRDGTIYTVGRTHIARRYGYLVALGSDLSPRWAATLRGHLADGCNVLLPPSGDPGGCRVGAKDGVDPATNELPAGIVEDLSTASPVIAPDGSILYGAYTRYNHSRGHLLQFSAEGEFMHSYDFGWDVTPGIYEHDGTYSIVIKNNSYEGGSYCADPMACPPAEGGPYRITQLSPKLEEEWAFTSDNTESCVRKADGTVDCTSDHPHGFEWCINAPAIDRRGVVYANGEDGVVYAIEQGGKTVQSLFLGESVGAAYTPLSLDAKGRIYAENLGKLFVVGE